MEFSDKEILGLGGALASFLGGFWLAARKVTGFEVSTRADIERIDGVLIDHAAKIASHSLQMTTQQQEHQEDMENVRAFFTTAAGGQKFMTFPDHDLICSRNGRVMVAEMQHLTAAVKILTEQSADTGRKVGEMAVDIAVMKAEMKKP